MKTSIDVTIIEGRARGRTILKRVWGRFAPSILAASSIEDGSEAKYPFRLKKAKIVLLPA